MIHSPESGESFTSTLVKASASHRAQNDDNRHRNAPSIEVADVTKVYNVGHAAYPALRNVSLKIERGEFVSIIGPSGSGKSTLLNIIGALDRPTSGRVKINGIDLKRLSDDQLARIRNRRIGFIYQSFNLISRLTVLQNVQMPLMPRKMSQREREDRSKQMLETVGLGRKLRKHPTELSGGEQQRVAIARALVTKPEIVIGDEPTGNLDTKTTHQVMDYMAKVNRSGITVVIVTHNPEVAQYTPRIISVRDGAIEKDQVVPKLDSF
jgi:putative ABC transport system ATP-binding protein